MLNLPVSDKLESLHLIPTITLARLSLPQYSLTVQNHGIIYQSFHFLSVTGSTKFTTAAAAIGRTQKRCQTRLPHRSDTWKAAGTRGKQPSSRHRGPSQAYSVQPDHRVS